MWISEKELEQLKLAADGKNKEKDDLHEDVLKQKNKQISDLYGKIDKLVLDHEQDLQYTVRDWEIKLDLANKSKESEIMAKTNELSKRLSSAVTERDIAIAENKVLREAFKSMGVDVKDMKDMFNKLIDGISSKNSVQLISAGK